MWDSIATFILKKRWYFILAILAFTGVMGFYATKVDMDYGMQKLVPKNDPDFVDYIQFKKTFGEDGNKLVVGFQTDKLWKKDFFNDYQTLCDSIAQNSSIIEVISPARTSTLVMDSSDMFRMQPLCSGPVSSQAELDSLRDLFINLKFYDGLLYNRQSNVALTLVVVKDSILDSKYRIPTIQGIEKQFEAFAQRQGVEMHISGLPYVRTALATTVKDEIILFTGVAFVMTALLILLFFRSISTLAISLLFIAIGVLTMLGFSSILGYKLTLLTGTLPPLLVVVGVQNTIYLINKYHEEYRRHNNKAKALARIISRIGVATFLINFTTAIGFGTFYFTKTTMLEQFGLVAFLTINTVFFINIIGIPALYSFLPVPSDRQTAHLDAKNVNNFLSWVRYMAFNHKRRIYFWSILLVTFSAVFMLRLKPLAYMVDDIPHESKLYQDLEFFQGHFKGVMPYEILVTADDEGGATSAAMLNKAQSLQKRLRRFPELSKPLSVVEVVSFANQVYNQGDPRFYRVPNSFDLGEIAMRMPAPQPGHDALIRGLIDSTQTTIRISYQIKDVGSVRLDSLSEQVEALVHKIFPVEEYSVKITGTSAIFLKGNSYLFDSLKKATFWSLLIISLTMGLLFPSIRMVMIAIIPNLVPLLITAGTMGYFNVPLKPSTILVFSIAFGITVDATIHFMTTFRRELIKNNRSLRDSLNHTISEVGVSMVYSMVAVCSGFMIFTFSNFQGTQALGWLTGLTLFAGMAANLFLLPALILSFENWINARMELKETVLDLPYEDED